MFSSTNIGDREKRQHVLLTARDYAILKSLYDNTVMSYGQIARMHFANVQKATVINRLTKIQRAGFICRLRIPKMRLGMDENAIGVIFQITKDGIRVLKSHLRLDDLRDEPVRFHPFTLEHDLILVDLVPALKGRFGFRYVTNGKLICPQTATEKVLLPDLVCTSLGNGKEKVAIELELTMKSERRYRELILRYRLATEYTKVIYVVRTKGITDAITRVIAGRPVHPAETIETGKFVFLELGEILSGTNTLSHTAQKIASERGI